MAGGTVPAQLAPIFKAAGSQYGIPPAVLAGISSVESNLFRNQGPSSAGAVGGMQFLPSTARGLGINPLDPRQAIFGTAKLLIQYGYRQNPARAIGAYNGGSGNPQMGYARQVMAEAQRLAPQFSSAKVALIGGDASSLGSFSVPVTTQSFDQAGFKQALGKFIAGQAVKQSSGSANPFNATPGASKGLSSLDTSAPLFAKGLLSTSTPNPSDFIHAQTSLQQVAGGMQLNPHPAITAAAAGKLPKGLSQFQGKPVAAWIAPILQWAQQRGWRGSLTSGYRTLAQQAAIYNSGTRPAAKPGTSNHEMTAFPGGAVDVTDARQLSQLLARSPYASLLVWAGAKDPVHFSHPHNGSY